MALEGNALEVAAANVAGPAIAEIDRLANGNRADAAALADRSAQAIGTYAMKLRTDEAQHMASFVAAKSAEYEAHRQSEEAKLDAKRAEEKAQQELVASINAKITPAPKK